MAFTSDRKMFDVDVDCGECGKKITQLPFEPSGDKPVYCTDCLRKRRESRPRPERQMYDVDVTCAECGAKITQLPFQPTGDRPIYCFDCNKNRRG
jgi:CxxC-x17-CxxC domain-containing protein